MKRFVLKHVIGVSLIIILQVLQIMRFIQSKIDIPFRHSI